MIHLVCFKCPPSEEVNHALSASVCTKVLACDPCHTERSGFSLHLGPLLDFFFFIFFPTSTKPLLLLSVKVLMTDILCDPNLVSVLAMLKKTEVQQFLESPQYLSSGAQGAQMRFCYFAG